MAFERLDFKAQETQENEIKTVCHHKGVQCSIICGGKNIYIYQNIYHLRKRWINDSKFTL